MLKDGEILQVLIDGFRIRLEDMKTIFGDDVKEDTVVKLHTK